MTYLPLRLTFLLALLIILVSSCNKDELDELKDQNSQLEKEHEELMQAYSLAEAKNMLYAVQHDLKLVTDAALTGDGVLLEIEGGATLLLDDEYIKNYELDSMAWALRATMTDEDTINIGFLGVAEAITVLRQELNPFEANPLAAQLLVDCPVPGKMEVRITPKTPGGEAVVASTEHVRQTHLVDILGLYADHDNIVELVFQSPDGLERRKISTTITTSPLPGWIPEMNLVTAREEEMEPGMTLVSYRGIGNPNRPFLIDGNGEVRWLLDFSHHPTLNTLRYDVGIERLSNGHMYFGDRNTDAIYEVSMLGELLNQWPLPPGYQFHHEVKEKPDGNFLITASKDGSMSSQGVETVEDFVIELDRSDGHLVNVWDLKVSLQDDRTTWTGNQEDWFHGNAVYYDERDNTILVSGRTQGLVKLTANNEVVWILAPHKGWEIAGNGMDLEQFLLQPLDANGHPIEDTAVIEGDANHPDFEWNWYQHAPLIKPNGNVMLFDNGDNRNYSDEEEYSRAVEYAIDESAMTVQQVWSYGKELGAEGYSRIVSDVDWLPQTDHVFFCPGFSVPNSEGVGGKIIEVDYESRDVVFELEVNSGGFALHRGERMLLYPTP